MSARWTFGEHGIIEHEGSRRTFEVIGDSERGVRTILLDWDELSFHDVANANGVNLTVPVKRLLRRRPPLATDVSRAPFERNSR